MPKRITVDDFLRRAHEKHGNTYDYSLVNFVNTKTKVRIVCPTCGVFEQTPEKHMSGQGCPYCVQQRLEQTNMQRYGCRRPLQNQQILQSQQETVQLEYGVKNVMHLDDVKEKLKQTNQDRYGTDYTCEADSVRVKREETNKRKYGGVSPFCSQEVQAKSRKSWKQTYGVDNPMFDASVVKKVSESKFANGTFHTSSVEDELYDLLVTVFGEEDVKRQYTSDVYPFACDFYLPSRDLYLELNASWTHGFHWFDVSRSEDMDVKHLWESKQTDYYANAVHVWTQKDVEKRETAKKNGLNYIVFWQNSLQDAILWFASGCPNGQDWRTEYSWLPERHLSFDGQILNSWSSQQASRKVKQYQFDVFYERELRLWKENPCWKDGLSLQMFLYENRYHYLSKTPAQLSNLEMLRGMTISGVLRGYTVFDVKLMSQFLESHSDVTGIYDPFAGWGERMLCAHHYGRLYVGVDVREDLLSGYQTMIQNEHLSNVSFTAGDSRLVSMPSSCNTVITCPPYFDREIYSDVGLEQLTEKDFLEGMQQVIGQCSHAVYICMQMNQRLKTSMLPIMDKMGWVLQEALRFSTNKASHMNRRNGQNRKREFEEFCIFTRKETKDVVG